MTHRDALHPLQPAPTSYIGRKRELAALQALLADTTCRLLTLTGPGGIGKSRLAREAVARSAPAFPGGVASVALDSVTNTDGLLAALAAALQLPLGGASDPLARLGASLHEKAMLLILDPFEHLVESSPLLAELLAAAPTLRMLVASREALRLQEEWRFPIAGLDMPPDDAEVSPDGSDATQLFVERARRVRPALNPADEWDGIVRICRLVEGMPLALELAAGAAQMLPCVAIADSIAENLDVLATTLRNVSDRHRSVQAVFDHSWARLSEPEQATLMQLSVFAGGFDEAAAAQVAAASLPRLTALHDRSLLQHDARGRYRLHALLRQYAAAHLAAAPDQACAARWRHCAYYAAFLVQRDVAMNGPGQHKALAEIAAELDNISVAWRWAADNGDAAAIRQAADALYLCLQFQSRFREGAELFTYAARGLEPYAEDPLVGVTLAEILCHLGWLWIRLGQLDEAQSALERSRDGYAALGEPPPARGMATDPAIPLGVLATIRGDYRTAAGLGGDALARARARDDHGNAMLGSYVLASVALAQGAYAESQQHAQYAFHLAAEVMGNRWFMAYCLIELGDVALALEQPAAARTHYQAAYTLREAFDDPEGRALALRRLGGVGLHERHPADASNQYGQALAIYQTLDDRGGLVAALNGLGRASLMADDLASARRHLQRALQIASDNQLTQLLLHSLLACAELLLRSGDPSLAAIVLTLLARAPAASQEVRRSARRLLGEPGRLTQPGGELPDGEPDLAALVTAVELALGDIADGGESSVEPAHKSERAMTVTGNAALLSAREREVLGLVAAGCSNREIAERLVIGVGTVKAHIHHIITKLEVRNRSHAAALARELGLD